MKKFIFCTCAIIAFCLETLGSILCIACIVAKRNPLNVIADVLS